MISRHENSLHNLLGYTFILISITDLVIMPVLYAIWGKGTWKAQTIDSSGSFYLSFGMILGVGQWRKMPTPTLPDPK